MAEGARLESVYTATYRGFESPPHRHIQKKSAYKSTGFFFAYYTRYPADKNTVGPVSVSATGRSHIAGWQRKRLIRPTKTSQDR